MSYNGHKNWAYWNVALWIGNDEGLYLFARECIADHKGAGGLTEAAREFVAAMGEGGKTPDGARWSMNAVRAALAGLDE